MSAVTSQEGVNHVTEGVNHVTAQLMRDVKEIDPGLVQDLNNAEQDRLKQLQSQVISVCLSVVVVFFEPTCAYARWALMHRFLSVVT